MLLQWLYEFAVNIARRYSGISQCNKTSDKEAYHFRVMDVLCTPTLIE